MTKSMWIVLGLGFLLCISWIISNTNIPSNAINPTTMAHANADDEKDPAVESHLQFQGLTKHDAKRLFRACVDVAKETPSAGFRPKTKHVIMWCATLDKTGLLIDVRATDTSGIPRDLKDSDAWLASIWISVSKAWTALGVSSNELAAGSGLIGLLTRPDFQLGSGQPGTNTGPAPLWQLTATNVPRIQGDGWPYVGERNFGLVAFDGGFAIYHCETKQKLGAFGVSGDGIEEDASTAKQAIEKAGFCVSPS
jgi:uncharacterized protein GlcG (DUF336 family)